MNACSFVTRSLLAALPIAFLLGSPSVARADDDDEPAVSYAVQNREFHLKHEILADVGILPNNAFTKGITIGAGYTYHLSTLWAWEIARFEYVFNVDTGLRSQLAGFMVAPTAVEAIDYFGSSSILLKPFNGKLAFFNKTVIHAEIFLALGGAFGKYENPSAFRVGVDAGAGIRLHLGEHLSVRFDIRDYALFKSYTPQNELYLSLAAALSFGGGPER